MISFQDALQIVLDNNKIMPVEQVPFSQAIGRVLAQDVVSDMDMPPFDKSAMDGFAIREEDFDETLEIIETIAAGQVPQKVVGEKQAARIMTGAPMPEGANFVVQVELSEVIDENQVRFTKKPKNNVIPKAEDVKNGDAVLKAGEIIDARHIAVMASVGCINPMVYKKPKVGIISTGDELVEPQNKPSASQIRNSNGHQLVAQTLGAYAEPVYYGIVIDTYEATYNAITKGLAECDVLMLTGGVSMGDFDYVPQIMKDLGVDIKFNRVAVQPGKPATFGIKDDKFVVGLPGNPVSSFVQFEILVKPLLFQLMGRLDVKPETKMAMSESFTRRKVERRAYIPVEVSPEGTLKPVSYNGSAHIHALPKAHGLLIIEKGVATINKGELVHVRLF